MTYQSRKDLQAGAESVQLRKTYASTECRLLTDGEVGELEKRLDEAEAGHTLKGVDTSRVVPWTVSTEVRDREGDRILQKGWDLKAFKRAGGPILVGHDHASLPIARSIDTYVDRRETKKGEVRRLRMHKYFPSAEESEISDTIFRMHKAGLINTASVGFIATKFGPDPEDPSERGFLFEKQELLESSLVAVPANPEAVAEAKSLGIPVGGAYAELIERALDEGWDLGVERPVIERARKIAKGLGDAVRGAGVTSDNLEAKVNELNDRLSALEALTAKAFERPTESNSVQWNGQVEEAHEGVLDFGVIKAAFERFGQGEN